MPLCERNGKGSCSVEPLQSVVIRSQKLILGKKINAECQAIDLDYHQHDTPTEEKIGKQPDGHTSTDFK